MKVNISEITVSRLAFMLDDCYRLDVGHDEEHKIWSDFDCISILRDLLSANANRNEDGYIDISEDTVNWLVVILEDMLANDEPSSKRELSAVTLQALKNLASQ